MLSTLKLKPSKPLQIRFNPSQMHKPHPIQLILMQPSKVPKPRSTQQKNSSFLPWSSVQPRLQKSQNILSYESHLFQKSNISTLKKCSSVQLLRQSPSIVQPRAIKMDSERRKAKSIFIKSLPITPSLLTPDSSIFFCPGKRKWVCVTCSRI